MPHTLLTRPRKHHREGNGKAIRARSQGRLRRQCFLDMTGSSHLWTQSSYSHHLHQSQPGNTAAWREGVVACETPTSSWGAIDGRWLLSKGEPVFFKNMAPGGSALMALYHVHMSINWTWWVILKKNFKKRMWSWEGWILEELKDRVSDESAQNTLQGCIKFSKN